MNQNKFTGFNVPRFVAVKHGSNLTQGELQEGWDADI